MASSIACLGRLVSIAGELSIKRVSSSHAEIFETGCWIFDVIRELRHCRNLFNLAEVCVLLVKELEEFIAR